MPELSIITQVKNAGRFIDDCIESGIRQGYDDWEWIWVNDHSDDDTEDKLTRWTQLDPRIKLLQNSKKGIIPALEKALKSAKGKLITRMDADDLMPDGRLQTMSNAAIREGLETVITGQVIYFGERDVSEGYRKYESWLNNVQIFQTHYQNIYRECVVASPNWMMHTEKLKEIRGFSKLKYPEDYDLVFRWYANDLKIKALKDVTLMWREHSARTSRTSDNYNQEAFFNLKINRFLELDAGRNPLCLWGTGRKADLVCKVLRKKRKNFLHMDYRSDKDKRLVHFEETAKLENPKILVAVYPPEKQLESIRQYLAMLKLYEGKNYWIL